MKKQKEVAAAGERTLTFNDFRDSTIFKVGV